jgi:trigger factor
LKFEKEILDDHQAKLTVVIEPSQFDQFKIKAVRKISVNTKIAGFRPGKAPIDVVKRLYGDEAIDNEAIEILVNEIYPDLLKEADLKPSGAGKLEKVESKNPPKLVFLVPLEPEISLGDYHSIRMDYTPELIDKEDVDKVIHRLQLNFSTAEPTNHLISQGDLVTVKINANEVNATKDESGVVLKDSPLQLIIGENDSQDEKFPYDGFEQQLLGLKAGDINKFGYHYPKDSPYEKLQGKDIEFIVNVQSVRILKKPELNDEFAKTVGNYDSYDKLQESIKKELEESKTQEYDHNFIYNLIDKIISTSTIKYPPQFFEEEKQRVLKNFEQDLATQNLDLTTYLKMNELDKDKFIKEEIEPAAKHQLEHSLILEEISKKEKIELEKDELKEEYSQTFLEIQSKLDYKKLRRQFTSKGLANRVLIQAASRLMNKRVNKRLIAIATGKYIEGQEIKETKEVLEEKHVIDKANHKRKI